MIYSVIMRGGDKRLLCTLLRHESDDVPYEYVDPDYEGIKKTLESLYALEDD
jgi:hypothetical protein